jgi:solute carrier family 44 protein 1 (choline transporter-like protein)/choline transporter-like protein 2/4/5
MTAKIQNGDDPGRNYYLYGSYGCAAVTVGFFVVICCFYTKIRIAIRIMETAADFVTEVCLIVLVPPITTLLISIWVVVWVPTFIYVWCQGEFAAAENGAIYGQVTWTEETRYSVLVYLFGGLWGAAFISACNQFIIASAACIWYFSPRSVDNENDKDVDAAITKSVWRLFRYHLGSLAFGSFLVAVV